MLKNLEIDSKYLLHATAATGQDLSINNCCDTPSCTCLVYKSNSLARVVYFLPNVIIFRQLSSHSLLSFSQLGNFAPSQPPLFRRFPSNHHNVRSTNEEEPCSSQEYCPPTNWTSSKILTITHHSNEPGTKMCCFSAIPTPQAPRLRVWPWPQPWKESRDSCRRLQLWS